MRYFCKIENIKMYLMYFKVTIISAIMFSLITQFIKYVYTKRIEVINNSFVYGNPPLHTMTPQSNHHMYVKQDLYNQVKILCLIITYKNNLLTKAVNSKNYWTRKCNKVIFVGDEFYELLPTINISSPIGKNHLLQKINKGLDYVHDNFIEDYDWFLKADDDTYVVMENLRAFLYNRNSGDLLFYGLLFNTFVDQGYYSGGAGFVLSKASLKLYRNRTHCHTDDYTSDLRIGECMYKLHVHTADTRDIHGAFRFNCFRLQDYFSTPDEQPIIPRWYDTYSYFNHSSVHYAISQYPISFHYVKNMHRLDYFLYKFKRYGRMLGHPWVTSMAAAIPDFNSTSIMDQHWPADTIK